MLDMPLHTGIEHPNLTLLVLSGLLTFILGLGFGTYRKRITSAATTLVRSLAR